MSGPLASLLASSDAMKAFGALDAARIVRATLARAEAALIDWWNEPLALKDAAEWGGYSESQLRRLIKDGTIPVATNGLIRRRDVPVHAGHKIPLETEPAEVASADWVTNLRERRHSRGAP